MRKSGQNSVEGVDDSADLVHLIAEHILVFRFAYDSEERLGIGLANAEPPVGVFDSVAVEIHDLYCRWSILLVECIYCAVLVLEAEVRFARVCIYDDILEEG